MRRFVRVFAPCLLILAIALEATAASKSEQIDTLVSRYHELGQFNGSVLVADADGVVQKKGYGYANFEWQIPNTPDTRFRLGSITKQFTSMVILQLVKEGKLKLDDRITTHLPDYRKDTGDRVTIKHLLNHTSGIPSYTSVPGFFANDSRDAYEVNAFVKRFASGDLEFEPGSKYVYNNSAYFILGAIIEKLTGKTYAAALEERIFKPLGMKHTGYDVSATVIPKRASGYVPTPDGVMNAPYLDMTIPYAAGSLYSTVEDLYLWDRALYTEKLLPATLRAQMFAPGLNDYGFGWVINKAKLHDESTEVGVIMHGGGIHGFNTLLVRVPDRKELVVLLDNTSRGGKLDEMAMGAISILRGIEPRRPRASIAQALTPHIDDVNATIARYRQLKANESDDYDFSESELNTLGYRLLANGRIPDAIEIFKLNVEMFPDASNPYDSLGEAYLAAGNRELALANYKRSLELDPKNTNAAAAIARLENPQPAVESKYPLEAFVGNYPLAPQFVIAITLEDGSLKLQATGQPKTSLAQESATEFRVIGAPARIVFVMDETSGKATSLVLHQGGREMPAPKQ